MTTATVIFTGIAITATYFFLDTVKTQKVLSTKFDLQSTTRGQLDSISKDIANSTAVLDTITIGPNVLKSDYQSAFLLKLPAHDSAGNGVGSFDTIAYHLVGSTAPFKLVRQVAPGTGSKRQAETRTVANHVYGMTVTYYAHETLPSDGKTSSFTLTGVALASSLVVNLNGAEVRASNAANSLLTVLSKNLNFSAPPKQTDTVEAIYEVDPSVDSARVAEVQVSIKTMKTASELGANLPSQIFEAQSRAMLLNH